MDPNYYAGSYLNRLSWLRQSTPFLRSALTSPKSRFVLYDGLNALVSRPADPPGDTSLDGDAELATLPWSAVAPALGPGAADGSAVLGDDGGLWPREAHGRGPRARAADDPCGVKPALVFLGVDERGRDASVPSQPAGGPSHALEDHSPGSPYWALDVSQVGALRDVAKVAELLRLGADAVLEYTDMRAGMMDLKKEEAAVAGQGRALLDWHRRNQYCAGCGRPTRAVWAGWKRACIPPPEGYDWEGDEAKARPPCISSKGVHNFSYPRTDPAVIMAIIHPTEDAILLGRQRTWPKGFYSCLAGFVEPGESLEDAVRREVHEEAGVVVRQVRYHSTQPWPYPCSLMMGAIGVAAPDPKVRLDLDNELEDARFFPRSAILKALDSTAPRGLTRQEYEGMDAAAAAAAAPTGEARSGEALATELPSIRLPPRTAIAFKLVESWARRLPGWEGAGTEGEGWLSKM